MRLNKRNGTGASLVLALALLLHSAACAQAPASAAASAPAQTKAASPAAIVTVQAVLEQEARLLVGQSGPVKSAKLVPLPPQRPTVRVAAIYGSGSQLKVDLVWNGQSYNGQKVGAKLGSGVQQCELKAIEGRCVVWSASTARLPAASAKHTAASASADPAMCPRSCWTGIAPAPASQGLPSGGAMPPRSPASAPWMPMPVVLPPVAAAAATALQSNATSATAPTPTSTKAP